MLYLRLQLISNGLHVSVKNSHVHVLAVHSTETCVNSDWLVNSTEIVQCGQSLKNATCKQCFTPSTIPSLLISCVSVR